MAIVKYGRHTYGGILLKDRNDRVQNISVGKYCSIAGEVTAVVSGHNHNFVSTFPFLYMKPFKKMKHTNDVLVNYRMSIGNDVWIGRKSLLVGNVTVGDGCVIGAGSVIRGKIEPYSIMIGNPAQLVGKRFSDEQIEKLLEIQWWHWDDEKIKENVNLIYSENIDEFIKEHG